MNLSGSIKSGRGLSHADDWFCKRIVDAIQSLDGCNELIEHLVVSVQVVTSAAEISRLARCMAHCDMEQFDWDSDIKSFRKRGIEALMTALKSNSIIFPEGRKSSAGSKSARLESGVTKKKSVDGDYKKRRKQPLSEEAKAKRRDAALQAAVTRKKNAIIMTHPRKTWRPKYM